MDGHGGRIFVVSEWEWMAMGAVYLWFLSGNGWPWGPYICGCPIPSENGLPWGSYICGCPPASYLVLSLQIDWFVCADLLQLSAGILLLHDCLCLSPQPLRQVRMDIASS